MTTKPLSGLKVLDLTHVLAGPYCTYQLSLLGADVVKIESPRGDMTRPWGGEEEQIAMGMGTGFVAQNSGKRSVVIDITTKQGASLVKAMSKEVDIFVENYRPGTMQDHGLDHESLKVDNPGLIYLSISAFGQNGPLGHRPGFDDVIQATSGFMSINERGDGPIRTGGPVLDYATGMHSTAAVLAAVLLRQQTGEGQRIDIAMQDVTMLLMNRHTSIAATTGEALPPGTNRDGPLLGRYAVKNGYVMLAGYRASHQRGILKALGLEAEAALGSAEFRAQMPQIEAKAEQVLLTKTAQEWDAVFGRAAVVGGGVKDLTEVLATGQPAARGLLTKVESNFGEHQVTTAGYRINDQVFQPGTHVPRLGEHTQEVLVKLGYSESDIAKLAEDNIIRC